MTVPDHFSQVYLVDLSPSLCAVASKRFEKLGWTNVKVLCTDARRFKLPTGELSDELFSKDLDGKADWITMSYSLSMIPEYVSYADCP
jgi:betaine lipid synthase